MIEQNKRTIHISRKGEERMELKAKLNSKYYMISFLLLGLVVFAWYGLYFLNANDILMEDNTPMDAETKMLFTVLLGLVGASWTLSLVTLIRQMLVGAAFRVDRDGIHTTATLFMLFAFIFVVPVKTIPYEAIRKVSEENGILSVSLDKSKIKVSPILRPLVRKEYHFFLGFTKEKPEDIKRALDRFMGNYDI